MLWHAGASGDGQAAPPPTPFHRLFRRLFPALLRLAASSERVASQLFRDLLSSLVHWLTR